MSNGPLHRPQSHNDWESLKGLLKEKLAPKSTYSTDTTTGASSDSYWNRFQEITGKSKEEIQSSLGRF